MRSKKILTTLIFFLVFPDFVCIWDNFLYYKLLVKVHNKHQFSSLWPFLIDWFVYIFVSFIYNFWTFLLAFSIACFTLICTVYFRNYNPTFHQFLSFVCISGICKSFISFLCHKSTFLVNLAKWVIIYFSAFFAKITFVLQYISSL